MKAMILAAGRGERMRPLTDTIPKPLLKVADKALIEHHIESLVEAGVDGIVINHAHFGEKIEQYLGNGSRYGVEIQYSPEEKALETGGGIFRALPKLGDEPFWVVNGDVWTDYAFETPKLKKDQLAHLVLVPNPDHHPRGDFVLNKDCSIQMEGENRFTFSGIGFYRPELFDGCKEGRFQLATVLKKAMANDKVWGECYEGQWRDIGTPERLYELDACLKAKLV